MLFDHGSDSITAFLIAIQFVHILGIYHPLLVIGLMFGFIAITEFCALWTQYCTGIFRLGRINCIDEGLPMYALMCFLAPVLEIRYYANQYHVFGTYLEEFVVFMSGLLCV